MLYGLYLSATGVMTNSYRQDVISNNLANAETSGFRRELTTFRERPTASTEMPGRISWTDPRLDKIGGGTYADSTAVDTKQGGMEETGNKLDAAINGTGYFAVDDNGQTRLTRNGEFMLDRAGNLISANGNGIRPLDPEGNPIKLDPTLRDQTYINLDGTINQGSQVVAKLNVVDVPDPTRLKNEGRTTLSYPDMGSLTPSQSELQAGFTERSNVDPTTELTALMETQRLLEANANMIHTQDDTLDKLVNTVGKVS
jgi:flagellar basal-body rod protein FlgF